MKKTIAECQRVDWSMGYSEHMDRMEARYNQGDHQLFCSRCDRWKFRDELCDEARPCETKRTKDGGFKVVKELPWLEEKHLKIVRHLQVPTGDILVVEGNHGLLEMVSLGDYGKDVNVKCDAMGLTREITRVVHADMLPLTEKWVLTVSTQYGCSMRCQFCDVPKVGPGKNATVQDLVRQVLTGLALHPEIHTTQRLNIHFARMGEPTWNPNVLDATKWLKTHVDPEFKVHPVASTMMPRKNEWLKTFIHTWMRIKNRLYQGNAGLQLSINSTKVPTHAIYCQCCRHVGNSPT